MIYAAEVRCLGVEVEEEVILAVCGQDVTCFVNMLPCGVKVGYTYQVDLIPMVFNDYVVSEVSDDVLPSIIRIENSFSYMVTGTLVGNRIEVGGLVFEDDVLLSEFGFLEGRTISWKVDRIDAEFIETKEANRSL